MTMRFTVTVINANDSDSDNGSDSTNTKMNYRTNKPNVIVVTIFSFQDCRNLYERQGLSNGSIQLLAIVPHRHVTFREGKKTTKKAKSFTSQMAHGVGAYLRFL